MKNYSSVEFVQRFYELLALIAQHKGRCPISKQVGCNKLFIVVAILSISNPVPFLNFLENGCSSICLQRIMIDV